jgi:hypothetical protein
MYIYKFTHIATDRCYIGQTIQSPNQRRLEHICDSKYTTKEYHFHNALRKYGVDAFTFEVIAEARRKSMAATAFQKKLNMEASV